MDGVAEEISPLEMDTTGNLTCGNRTLDEITPLGGHMERSLELLEEVRIRFPWIGKRTEGWNMEVMAEVDNHLGAAILNISTGAIDQGRLHSGVFSRSWRLADGLAAFLTCKHTMMKFGKVK